MNFLQKTKRKVAPSLPPLPAVSFAQYVSQRMGLSICSYTKTPFNKHICEESTHQEKANARCFGNMQQVSR